MGGRVSHFEIPFDDAERARTFYHETFDWAIQPMPEMNYTMVSTGPTGEQGMPAEPGYIGGGMFQREGSLTSPIITIVVDDLGDALKSVEEHGGKAISKPQEVPGMGIGAYFTDPEGNVLGLWQDLSMGRPGS